MLPENNVNFGEDPQITRHHDSKGVSFGVSILQNLVDLQNRLFVRDYNIFLLHFKKSLLLVLAQLLGYLADQLLVFRLLDEVAPQEV